uniref:Uncharacterized protein n=1 Tax=Pithovirus LCPAC302 TaxID=2506593 RepID=A0A481ZA36_9VIRU|nr:MAG: hypothetical protein LCPAC302_01310 [Pithovirus LCPAC302]
MFKKGDQVIYTDNGDNYLVEIYRVYEGYYDLLLPEKNVMLESLELCDIQTKHSTIYIKGDNVLFKKKNNMYLAVVSDVDMIGKSAIIRTVQRYVSLDRISRI